MEPEKGGGVPRARKVSHSRGPASPRDTLPLLGALCHGETGLPIVPASLASGSPPWLRKNKPTFPHGELSSKF